MMTRPHFLLVCLMAAALFPPALRAGGHAPVVVDDLYQTWVDHAIYLDVTANDADADGDPLTLTLLGAVGVNGDHHTLASGAVVRDMGDGGLVYTPPPGLAEGVDSFQYGIPREGSGLAVGTVTIEISSAGQAPNAALFAVEPDGPLAIPKDGSGSYDRFPASTPGKLTSRVFLLRNVGIQPLVLQQAIGVSAGSGFKLHADSAPPAGTSLHPGGELRFRVTFRPSSLGTLSATVTLQTNDPAGPLIFLVEAESVAPTLVPRILVSIDGVALANGDTFSSAAGPDYVFEIYNPSNFMLTLDSIDLPEGYRLLEPLPEQVPPAGTDQFAIRLILPDFPLVEGALAFNTNVPDDDIFLIRENHRPIAVDDHREIVVGGQILVNVTANDYDPDYPIDEPVLLPGMEAFPQWTQGAIYLTPNGGRVELVDWNRIRYTQTTAFSGLDAFEYRIGDGRGRRAKATVRMAVGSPPPLPDGMVTILREDFARPDGTLLRGQSATYAAAGPGVWFADEAIVHGGQRATTTSSSQETHYVAYLPFSPGAHAGDMLEMEARFRVHDSQWMALAFTHGNGRVFGNNADLWLLLKPTGVCQILSRNLNQLGIAVPGSQGYPFHPEDLNQVKLRYDRSTDSVSGWVNGVRVFDRVPYSGGDPLVSLAESVTQAGLYLISRNPGGAAAGDLVVDDFTVRQGHVNSAEPDLLVRYQEQPLVAGQSMAFPSIGLGESLDVDIQLQNNGDADLLLDHFQLTGDAAWSWLTVPGDTTLAAGGSASLHLRLTGVAPAGAKSGNLSFETDQPGLAEFSLQLRGDVNDYPAHFLEIRRDFADVGQLIHPQDGLLFPDSVQGTAGVLAKLIIDNKSGQRLDLNLSVDPPQTWPNPSLSAQGLNPGARAFLDMRPDTASLGAKVATVTLTTDPPSQAFSFSIQSTVVVEPPDPFIIYQSDSVTVPTGGTAQFHVEVGGGTGNYHYEWDTLLSCCGFSLCAVASCSGQYPFSGYDTDTLTIAGVTAELASFYQCHITDDAGRFVTSQWVHLGLPDFKLSSYPVEQVVRSGDAAVFRFEASGDGPLAYQWHLPDGTPISPGDPRFQGADSNALTVLAADEASAGIYSCTVSDACPGCHTVAGRLRVVSDEVVFADPLDNGLLPSAVAVAAFDGSRTAVGNEIWTADAALTLSAEGVSAPAATAGFAVASLRFKPLAGQHYAVAGTFPLANLTPNRYVALGFSQRPRKAFETHGRLWLRVFGPDSYFHRYQVLAEGSDQLLLEGTLVAPQPDWALEVDPVAGSYRVTNGGEPLFSWRELAPAFKHDATHAGFQFGVPENAMTSTGTFLMEAFELRSYLPVRVNDDHGELDLAEQSDLIIDLLANDLGTGLQVETPNHLDPRHGHVQNLGNGLIRYTPDAGFRGQDDMAVRVRDVHGNEAVARVTLSVFEGLQAPIARDDYLLTLRDTAVAIAVAGNDGHTGDRPFSLRDAGIERAPDHGAIALLPDEQVLYMPDPGFTGIDRFSYQIIDERGVPALGQVTVIVSEAAFGSFYDHFTAGEAGRANGALLNGAPLEGGRSYWTSLAPQVHPVDPSGLRFGDSALVRYGNGEVVSAIPFGDLPAADFEATLDLEVIHNDDIVESLQVGFMQQPGQVLSGRDQAALSFRFTDACRCFTVVNVDKEGQVETLVPWGTWEGYDPRQPIRLHMALHTLDGTLTVSANGETLVDLGPGALAGLDPQLLRFGGIGTTVQPTAAGLPQLDDFALTVSPVFAKDDQVTTAFETAAIIAVGENDRRAGTILLESPPRQGVATVLPSGDIQYTPDPGFSGDDSFRYLLRDGAGNEDGARVSLHVTAEDFLFADDFESADLTAWHGASRNLEVTEKSALAGRFGLAVTLDGTMKPALEQVTAEAETAYRCRFYFDPNSLRIGDGEWFTLFQASGAGQAMLRLELGFDYGPFYRIRINAREDDGSWRSGEWVQIDDGPHLLEVKWSAGTSEDGILRLFVDEVLHTKILDLDNATRFIDLVSLGGPHGLDPATRGTLYLDAFESRTTTQIGPP